MHWHEASGSWSWPGDTSSARHFSTCSCCMSRGHDDAACAAGKARNEDAALLDPGDGQYRLALR
jgi:hypothetical protein